jgi:hypothetical protein
MTPEPRHQLAALLGKARSRGTFTARRTASPADLHIEVAGIGPIQLPVTSAQARQLVAIARPARYGLGERTFTDARVRDTWEVPKNRVKIDKRWWNRTLLPILDGLRGDLGLLDGSRLTAELHSVLVYTPGQFFVPHQDTEKSDDMIGTLTVTLPGSSKGGELVIDHAGEQVTHRSSATLLSFVAFYADCRHEVRPVTSGYRVVLTYNLLLTGKPAAHRSPRNVTDLTDCLTEHFVEHDRLVYLLDHEYTPRGLGWSKLKGVDAERVSALRVAAQATECEVALALADVHEIWNAYEPDEYRRYRRRAKDDEEYELEDLVETEISLESWFDATGAEMNPVVASVADGEVCATTPSASMTPYESEYEGYLGNYGNTLDRRYHRGAVVLWPRQRDFAVRAEASPTWALDRLAELIDNSEPDAARDLAATLGSFWTNDRRTRSALDTAPAFGRTLAIAVGFADAELAAMLLHPFRLEKITPACAPALVTLVDAYGEEWLSDLLRLWETQTSRWNRNTVGRTEWLTALPVLSRSLIEVGGAAVARILLTESWKWLSESIAPARAALAPSHRSGGLDQLVAPVAGLLVAASADAPEIVTAMTNLLDDEDLLTFLGRVLRAVDEPDAVTVPHSLVELTVDRLRARLTQPVRDPEDWSIQPTGVCPRECRECRDLTTFLLDPTRRTVEWRLSEQYRRHLEERIRTNELPVDHHTLKSGRPYTIALAKSRSLFDREAQQRRDDAAAVSCLSRHTD